MKRPRPRTSDIQATARWQSDAHERRRKYRYLISASHHVTWFLGKRLPRMFPLVFVLGYPKSGTSWVCQLLADYLHLPFPQHAVLPIGFPAVVHGHETVSSKYPRAVYVMRDGRDALVSLYFHLAGQRTDSHGAMVSPTGDQLRRDITWFVRQELSRPEASRANWGNHVRSYMTCGAEHVSLLRYEDLLADTAESLTAVIEHLTGEPVEPVRLRRTVEKFSFRNQSGRRAGQEDRASYLRKGQAGDWIHYFTPEAAEIFAVRCGGMLIACGYETDDAWVGQVAHRAAA